MKHSLLALVAAVAVAGGATSAHAQVSGSGASFPFPIYSKWADAYKKETNVAINYQSTGSSAGIKAIKEKTVTFGASDAPLSAADLEKDGLVQFPMVMGGVVPVFNLDGIKPGEIVLDGDTLAKIYLGDIKTWDDAAIKKLNPNAKLPSLAIATVYRSDGSGTTNIFTNYLSKVSADFKSKIGAGTSVKWPVGIGGKGNEGVAATVGQSKGAIGYVEYAYAKVNKMSYADMINADGKKVAPDLKTFQAAGANADWKGTPGYAVMLTNQKGETAWPITGATFILMQKTPAKPEDAAAAKKFFEWALTKGDKMAEELDYVPMPDAIAKEIIASFGPTKS